MSGIYQAGKRKKAARAAFDHTAGAPLGSYPK
jgi:hypothetical protein